jgi:coproporphyrinogen III oxidase-like Fe-S oxidoreductase
MLSERLITTALRVLNKEYLHTEPIDLGRLPDPEPGHGYVLYAHVPFCERLCPYCSFNRFLFHEQNACSYFRSLRAEMRMVADLGYDFASLYIGGGTPTILIDELCDTIDLAREIFPGIGEVSSETSPNHITEESIAALASRVQRLSVGVQSFDDELLQQMARYDKYGCGREVFEHVSLAAGRFHSLNVDMIFNFPSQTPEMLARDIELVKETGANQTTFYPLMASPKTRRELARTIGDIDYAREAAYYRTICSGLAPDFEPASAWTFSKEKSSMIDEYIVDYDEYVGVGSGALSFLGGRMYHNTFSLKDYEKRISSGRMSVAKAGRPYSRTARLRYHFVTEFFGLSLDRNRFLADWGISIDRALPAEMAFMRLAGGIASDDGRTITLTEKGRYLLLVMMRETLAASNDIRDQAREELPAEEKMMLYDNPGASHPTVTEECLVAS